MAGATHASVTHPNFPKRPNMLHTPSSGLKTNKTTKEQHHGDWGGGGNLLELSCLLSLRRKHRALKMLVMVQAAKLACFIREGSCT